jgi:hypothetical protein
MSLQMPCHNRTVQAHDFILFIGYVRRTLDAARLPVDLIPSVAGKLKYCWLIEKHKRKISVIVGPQIQPGNGGPVVDVW